MTADERKWFTERVTDRMNELIKEIDHKQPPQPEPQAGDVWEIVYQTLVPSYAVFYTETHRGRLRYKYTGNTGERWDDSNYGVIELFRRHPETTRIFSLQEYLKNKEGGK